MSDDTKRDILARSAFIVWEDFGTEGWQPRPYQNHWDLTAAIENGEFHCSIIITVPTKLAVKGAP